MNKTDIKNKERIQQTGYLIYCVRGNHEERPKNIPSMGIIKDNNVNGYVYIEHPYDNIRYFEDGLTYEINGKSILIIGGAYSVDKWYRLSTDNPNKKWTGWFKDEQLTADEMAEIFTSYQGKHFNYVFSHTCPYSWEPRDLFLSSVDQNMVDDTMEVWLDRFKDSITFDYWKFAHFHDNRRISDKVKMYFYEIEELDI